MDTPNTTRPGRNPIRSALGYLARRPGLVAALVVLSVVLVAAFFPGWLTSRDPLQSVPADKLQAPSSRHWLGTDQLGRDLYTRVVYGAALSLRATAIAVALALVAGSVIGLVAGSSRRWIDDAVMRLVDMLMSIPALLLSLVVVTALGFGTTNVAIAVGVASTARFARVMRAEVLRVRSSTFVEAAQSIGVRRVTVLARHVLPHAAGPVLVLAALGFGTATLAVAALSFLGYGAPAPTPEWGSMLAEGRNYLATAWWMTTLPGLVVTVTVLAATRLARAFEGDGGGRR